MKDAVMIQVIRMLPDFGPHGRLAWEYAELFNISPPLNARKLYRILSEVREFFAGGGFVFRQKRYEISRDGLAAAMRTVCNALGERKTAPLQNHNYLKKVAVGVAEEEAAKRSKENERNLRERERGLKSGNRAEDGVAGGAGMPEFVKDFIRGFGSNHPADVPEKGAADGSHGVSKSAVAVDRAG